MRPYQTSQDLLTQTRFERVLKLIQTERLTIEQAVNRIGLTRRYFYNITTDEQQDSLREAKRQNSKKLQHKPWF